MTKYFHSIIWSILLVTQFILVVFFNYVNQNQNSLLLWLGIILWIISVIFGFLPIIIFKRKGNVKKGESYVHTNKLVKIGLYSIIRHPQYTAGILLSLALIFVSQTIVIVLLGLGVIPLLYFDILKADEYNIKKFGEEYKEYMKNVPGINFILGIIRLIKIKSKV